MRFGILGELYPSCIFLVGFSENTSCIVQRDSKSVYISIGEGSPTTKKEKKKVFKISNTNNIFEYFPYHDWREAEVQK